MKSSQIIVGVDEAGRGCLVGSVYAGAVIFKSDVGIDEFRDSKTLSESRRQQLYELILKEHTVGIGFANVSEITSLNILQAAMLAMKRAIEALAISEEDSKKVIVLVDGNTKIPSLPYQQRTIIKGDQKERVISAASIVAKVSRDHSMYKLAKEFPKYGFERHKGYGTEDHRKAIKEYGPISEHRPSFAGVKEHIIRH